MERLVILGAGESGVGTAILGKKKGFEVFVSDFGMIQEKYKEVLLHHELALLQHLQLSSLNLGVIILSCPLCSCALVLV